MNARLEKLEAEVATPESAGEARLKHIENDVSEIKADFRSNAAEIRTVRDSVAQLQVHLEVRTRELGEKLDARARALDEKIESRFRDLNDRLAAQGKEPDEAIATQGKELGTAISGLRVAVERTRTWVLYIVGSLALTVIGLVLRAS